MHCISLIAELKAFLEYVTGTTAVSGNTTTQVFNSEGDHEMAAVVSNTCGRQLTLSTLIADETTVGAGMKAVVGDCHNRHCFTMP